jgi:hypothetical protein
MIGFTPDEKRDNTFSEITKLLIIDFGLKLPKWWSDYYPIQHD